MTIKKALKLSERGLHDLAMEELASEVERNNPEAFVVLADIYYKLYLSRGGEYYLNRASRYMKRAVDSGVDAKDKLFSLFLLEGKYDEAEELLESIENEEMKHFLRSVLLIERGEEKKGVDLLSMLMSRDMKIPEAYLLYSSMLYREGKYNDALEILHRGAKKTKNVEIKEELDTLKSLLSEKKKIIVKLTFDLSKDDMKIVQKESVECYSPEEFVEIIGVSMEGDSMIGVFLPESKKLRKKVSRKIISVMPEYINKKVFDRIMRAFDTHGKQN